MNVTLANDFLVRAWMSPPEHTVAADTRVEEAFAVLKRERIRHLLVVDEDGELAGIVSDRDLRRPDAGSGEVLSVRLLYLLGDELRVRDVMTSEVVTVSPDTTTAEAARRMVAGKFGCLPVVDAGELVGILTRSDLLAALVDWVELAEVGEDEGEIARWEAVAH